MESYFYGGEIEPHDCEYCAHKLFKFIQVDDDSKCVHCGRLVKGHPKTRQDLMKWGFIGPLVTFKGYVVGK